MNIERDESILRKLAEYIASTSSEPVSHCCDKRLRRADKEVFDRVYNSVEDRRRVEWWSGVRGIVIEKQYHEIDGKVFAVTEYVDELGRHFAINGERNEYIPL